MKLRRTALQLTVPVVLTWMALSVAPAATAPTPFEDEVLRDAAVVFRHAVLPAPAIPASILTRARAIAVVPHARAENGAHDGIGVLSGRGGVDGWTARAFVSFHGAIPVNLESDDVDFVFVALTARGVDSVTQPRHGGLIFNTIPAGPLEEPAAFFRADLVAYIRFNMLFAGIAVDDWEFTDMRESNERMYGRPYSTDDILRAAGFFHLPKAARTWRDALALALRETS